MAGDGEEAGFTEELGRHQMVARHILNQTECNKLTTESD